MTNGLIDRPATGADAATLADLFNASEVAAGGHPHTTEEEQRVLLSRWVTDPERNTRGLFTPDGTIVAFAAVSVPPPGGDQVDLPGAVRPQWRRRGLGRDLMSWQLDRAAAVRREVAPEATWQLQTGTLQGDESAVRMLELNGFSLVRYFFDMEAATAGGHAVSVPDGLALSTYRPDLEHALYDAHMEAFADHWGFQQRPYEVWAAVTVGNPRFLPDLSRIVIDGDQIAAYLLSYTSQPGGLYIGQIGTRRPWRRRGLASLMIGDALLAASRAGLVTASLGVDVDSPTGAVSVYERAGFSVRSRWIAYQRPIGPA